MNVLNFISPSYVLEGLDNFIAQELVVGVIERLHAQSNYIHKDCMVVAEKLSEEIHFEELDDKKETDIEVKETLKLKKLRLSFLIT